MPVIYEPDSHYSIEKRNAAFWMIYAGLVIPFLRGLEAVSFTREKI